MRVTPVPAESRVHVRDRRSSGHRGSHGRSGCRHQIRGDAQRASGDTLLLLLLLLFARVNCTVNITRFVCFFSIFFHNTGVLRSLGHRVSHRQVRLASNSREHLLRHCASCMSCYSLVVFAQTRCVPGGVWTRTHSCPGWDGQRQRELLVRPRTPTC